VGYDAVEICRWHYRFGELPAAAAAAAAIFSVEEKDLN